MERTKQKSRKEKPNKCVDKEKSSSFIADVKTFKENLKIREILRTVKMNSSMRIKAPRGSKVMQNKDFNESEDIFEDTTSDDVQDAVEPPSATNTILNTEIDGNLVAKDDDEVISNVNIVETELLSSENDKTDIDTSVIHKSKSLSEGLEECTEINDNAPDSSTVLPSQTDNARVRYRNRKLSLDQTMLTRREGLSQSEMDLHSIGKLPLERKSSFFRKKMDNFLKNTTEIFKRQSLGSKTFPSGRRDSASSRMSVSMQSLNENSVYCGQYDEPIDKYHDQQGSVTSLHSSVTPARSNSSISVNVSDRPPLSEEESLAGSCSGLVGSQTLTDTNIRGLNQSYLQESLLNTRAISMSSGLDSANGQRKRNTSRSNRVSWLASESLTDYFRSLIQDEKGQETPEIYQDSIPANKYGPRTDSKGRRMSYVRAVSREDSSLPSRAQDSSLRRKKIPENEGNRMEIETLLAGFSTNGIPPLFGYTAWQISPEANEYLELLDSLEAIEKQFPFAEGDVARQEVLKELIYTESIHIRHLKVIVRVYIAAAHSLQNSGALTEINTSVLFLNIPDILNANIRFWERTIFPMVNDAMKNKTVFDIAMMWPGFFEFAEIFDPYEQYMQNQTEAVNYLRELLIETEFMTYLSWCNHQTDNRLQIADMLVKPMQRITKYTLILERLKDYTFEEDKKRDLLIAESIVKSYILSVNRSCRQKEEIGILDKLKIEPYEPDFRGDEEMEKAYKKFSILNLFLPMVDCAPHMMRCLIHQGDLRYKDFQKEFDAHVILFTDMMLICKKQTKTPKNAFHWKMQRPKILLHRIVPHVKSAKSSNDVSSLIYVILDEHGTSKGVFQLSELSKDPNPTHTIKVWEAKVQEAMMSYNLTKWYHKYPVKEVTIVDKDYNDENYKKENPKICAMEKKARERVASMLIPNKHLHYPEAGKEFDIPQSAHERDRGPLQLHTACEPGLQNINAWQARAPNFLRKKISQNINPYSSEQYFSFSGSSHEDPTSMSLHRSGSSVEQYMPQLFFDDVHHSPSITVNVVADIECSTKDRSRQPSPPTLVLQQSSPNHSPGPRSASAGAGGSENTLRVASPSHSMIHSLPDINAEFLHMPELKPIPQTASEKLYRSHQELMQRNRLAASQHYLSPDHRGSSYPPPSPTRPLKRALAFSYSFRSNPPLTRSKNVSSISQHVQQELQKLSDVPRRILGRKSAGSRQRSPSPSTSTCRDLNMPSTSDKPEKQKSSFQRRSKDSTVSASPERTQEEPSDDTDYDADDDRSRRSSKSNKGDKYRQKVESFIDLDLDGATSDEQVQPEPEPDKPVKKDKGKG